MSLKELSRRVDGAERAVIVGSFTYIAFAVLLWVWLVAPSFSLLAGAIRAVLSIIGYLGYGVFGAANAPIASFANYINLGYGIVAGTPILVLLLSNWLSRERHLTGVQNAIYSRSDIQPAPPRLPIRPRRRVTTLIIAIIAFSGVTVVTFGQFFTLAVRFEEAYKDRPIGCETDNSRWIEPWLGARQSIWGWFVFHHEPAAWCAELSREPITSFKAILPHTVFEEQLDTNRRLQNEIGKMVDSGRRLSADIPSANGTIRIEGEGGPSVVSLLARDFDPNPWKEWPDIRPPINLMILAGAAIAQIILLVRIYRHTSGKLIV